MSGIWLVGPSLILLSPRITEIEHTSSLEQQMSVEQRRGEARLLRLQKTESRYNRPIHGMSDIIMPGTQLST